MSWLSLFLLFCFSNSELKVGEDVFVHHHHKCAHDELRPLHERNPSVHKLENQYVRYENHPFYRNNPEIVGKKMSRKVQNSIFSSLRRTMTNDKCLVDGYKNIRVHLDTSSLSISGSIDPDGSKERYLKETILPNAKQKIRTLLSVVPVSGKFHIPRPSPACSSYWGTNPGVCRVQNTMTCGDATILGDHMDEIPYCASDAFCGGTAGAGFEHTDTVIYITAANTGPCVSPDSSTLAFAQTCIRDQFDRPTVGYANFCPQKLDPSADYFQRINDVTVTIHEIFHALGFSSDSFSRFRNHDGTPRTGTIVRTTTEREHQVSKIVTPTAIAVSRWHFNCSTMNGVEIEDGGGPGTAGSHVEMRVWQTDFMTGVLNPNSVFSHVTLAIMQDSGWYMANFHNAEVNLWGKNAGCDFGLKTCLEPGPRQIRPLNTFCIKSNQQRCTNDRRAIGICSISVYPSALPSYFQYFSNSRNGGMETNDYCPLYNQFVYALSDRTSNCKNPNNKEKYKENEFFGETYGPNSACFETSLRNSYLAITMLTGISGKCFEYSCMGTDSITISIAGGAAGFPAEITCRKDEVGAIKNPGGPWIGDFVCPDLTEICPEQAEDYVDSGACPNDCSSNGRCVPPCHCECNSGYGGEDCSLFECYGRDEDNPLVCSGHGTCTGIDTCICDLGWDSTNNCTVTTCGGIASSSPSVCSAHGTCVKEDDCVCDDDFYGVDCDTPGDGCPPGRYGTPGCGNLICYDRIDGVDLPSDVCNGGTCIDIGGDNNTCDCTAQPLQGPKCESEQCFSQWGPAGCSNHGDCFQTDVCTCDEGYYGVRCSQFSCNGILPGDAGVCLDQGTCIGADLCQCDLDWTGSNCQFSTCDGIAGDDPSSCNGNGICYTTDDCECFEGYTGNQCNAWTCFTISHSDSIACSEHGSCVGYNECNCTSGFGGFECDGLLCTGLCPKGCNYRLGICNSAMNWKNSFPMTLILVLLFFLLE